MIVKTSFTLVSSCIVIRCEGVARLQAVAGLGAVRAVSLGGRSSLVLTRRGEVWRLGGEARTVTRLDLGLGPGTSVSLVAALATTGLVVTSTGSLYSVSYKRGNKNQVGVA